MARGGLCDKMTVGQEPVAIRGRVFQAEGTTVVNALRQEGPGTHEAQESVLVGKQKPGAGAGNLRGRVAKASLWPGGSQQALAFTGVGGTSGGL